MAGTIAVILSVVVLATILAFVSRPMKIPREPGREGSIDDTEAVQAYDQVSRWPVFAIERYIMLNALRKYQLRGILLDIGCGPGYLAARISWRFSHLTVIGLDVSDKMLALARKNWPSSSYRHVEFLLGDAQRLPFPDSAVDYAVSSLSLHHWIDARVALREIHRVLKPGGHFLLFDLRRNASRLFYYGLKLGEILSPAAIRRTNGATGSFWSSYTADELGELLSASPWQKVQVQYG